MGTRMRDLTIFESLAIVTITGFESEPSEAIDPPGTANWLCEGYGMANDSGDSPQPPGILWTDYDAPSDEPWRFSVLVDGAEAEAVKKIAEEAGYYVDGIEVVSSPAVYGDGHAGMIEILKHRDGWVILPN
jgi:hypothetical protein